MNNTEIKNLAGQYLINTYGSRDLALVRAKEHEYGMLMERIP
jgi:hypothetical protein